jgi:hypothetical protein|tara:strand:+ start:32 stop:1270 length:1239 start_codon:yes stop_codon:yes gene_type:complete
MADKKAAVEVKQEGDFKIKKPKRRAKNLGKSNDEPVKVDFTQPEAQGEVIPDVVKLDLTEKTKEDAVPIGETKELPVGERTGDSKGVDEEVRVDTPKQEVVSETDTDTSITEVIEEVVESTPEKTKEVTQETIVEQPKLPENVDKLVKFMDETGGTVEDYVKLNKDYSDLNDNELLQEYLSQTKPHLSSEEINFLIEDNYTVDDEIDEEKDIRRKKLAYKEAVANAKKDLESLKTKYYADIKQRPGVTQEQQKAVDFFNRYNKQQESIKQSQERFTKNTNNLFNEEFKGFDYSLGEKKFRYKVNEPSKLAQTQSDINNFISKYTDKDGNLTDHEGYHKALYAAMNTDKLVQHFYEQGKADGVKDIVKKSKNPATETPRQVASGDVFVGGIKVKSISGADSSKLKIKKRTFNN